MPVYHFYDKTKPKITWEAEMRISELDQYLLDNPHAETVPSSPMVVGGVGSIKVDNGYKDVLREIKKKHRRSTINVPG
jgi:hypothetical protein